jgi:hypothetical protein
MPAPDEHAFDPLSEPMNTPRDSLDAVRYDWLGVRVGGPGATMRGSWPVLLAAMLAVFGRFFLIGLLSAGKGSPKRGSWAAPVARAAVPGKLGGESPIPAGVPSAIAEAQQRSVAPTRTSGVVQQTAPLAAAGATTTTATSASSAETPVAQEAAPAQHSTQPAGSHSSGSSSGGGSAGAAAGPRPRHAAAGGGSFDSSE